MANPFVVNRAHQGDFTVLSLEGYLDAHTAPEFEKVVESELQAGRVKMIVTCEKLSYISSAGLGVFMSFIEEIREAGGDIKICGLSPKVKQVFEILGFHSLFDIVDDTDAAMKRYAEAPVRES